MINSITVTNHLGESIKMELRFPERSGFLIKNVSGLGGSKANINLTELSTSDGSIFNSARVNARNIVFTLKLLENPTIEITRQKTYKYFPIKKRIKLLIESDTRTCEIYGNVEANEPDIFSREETVQISIMCPDPYFYSAGKGGNNITIFSGVEPTFSFPFDDDTFVVGDILYNREQSVYYSGDADIGVLIYIHSMGEVRNLTIYNSSTREVMKIDTNKLELLTGSTIIAGDDIIISTVKGNKYIRLLREGLYTNILNCLDKNPDWFQLSKGDNIFAFTAELGESYLQFRIENQTLYEGI